MISYLLCVASYIATVSAASLPTPPFSLPGFAPAVDGIYAANADLIPSSSSQSPAACAALCLATPNCISFNFCGTSDCGVSGWAMNYAKTPAANCSWTRRLEERDDSPAPRTIAWRADIPASGSVNLISGPIANAFNENIQLYLGKRDPLDMLYWFAKRAGVAAPNGTCWGWDGWIRGSGAGNYLMGAGSALQWTQNATLFTSMQAVVNGIRMYQDPTDGYLWAAPESTMLDDNMPDYCASWITRGLIDADRAGVTDALQIARESINYFNN